MNSALSKLLSKLLRETADKIDAGGCEMNDAEGMDLIEIISHRCMSKEEACRYLNLRRSRFDQLVREGKLPKGKKEAGFKELRWWKDELDRYKSNHPRMAKS